MGRCHNNGWWTGTWSGLSITLGKALSNVGLLIKRCDRVMLPCTFKYYYGFCPQLKVIGYLLYSQHTPSCNYLFSRRPCCFCICYSAIQFAFTASTLGIYYLSHKWSSLRFPRDTVNNNQQSTVQSTWVIPNQGNFDRQWANNYWQCFSRRLYMIYTVDNSKEQKNCSNLEFYLDIIHHCFIHL